VSPVSRNRTAFFIAVRGAVLSVRPEALDAVVAVVDGHAAETFGDARGRPRTGSPATGLDRLKAVKVNVDGR
jgi:hypothetical protein